MPAIAAITLADATPTNVVFTPRVADPEKSILAKRGYVPANTSAETDILLFTGVSPSSSARATSRSKVALSFPNPDYVPAVGVLPSVARFVGEWIVPSDFSTASRDDFKALTDAAVIHATTDSLVINDEGQY